MEYSYKGYKFYSKSNKSKVIWELIFWNLRKYSRLKLNFKIVNTG